MLLLNRAKLINQVNTSLAEELKREVDAGLETIAFNTFQELKKRILLLAGVWL
jgi:hypothetical protein